ncbi:spore germination protein (amino acid permease) [Cytobacillus eiseniae]|uniref:Spore germination protein (Amino acid permease) n=1 Tax=Cytobacillus eiseniae TaxID=762947 RepID=A0ABS4RDF4_9BACI|nr:GerAB/ArcD/ProY family transporter [Cytobacillus eiseniae]MBP2240405.1 spore germination protein (amino acid permease) [Cytobacillus eiseniae]
MPEQPIADKFKISPFLVLYMIMSMQIGIGVLGYQRIIVAEAKNDAWISVLVAGFALQFILWMIYKINETVNGDIVTAHIYVAGNFVGKLLSSIFIIYYFILSLTVQRSYLEVIQVWMFPKMSIFWYTLAYMILCIYIIYGGFRTVVGIAFFGLVLPSYLFPIFGFSLSLGEVNHLLPIFEQSIKDILLGAYKMSLTFIGFEVVLFFYPFIKEPKKSKKWAHLGLLLTTLIYTCIMIITITYFSMDLLAKSIWASLSMWKIVNFPFVERFEYIGIATWSLVILPNICIALWISSRLMKRIFNLQQKKGVIFIAMATLFAINFFPTRVEVNLLNNLTAKAGFVFTFIYIPLLFIAVMIAKKVKKT